MNTQRLLNLAAHLRSNNRHYRKFDIMMYGDHTGDCGCAIGELPYLDEVEWKMELLPALRNRVSLGDPQADAAKYFEIQHTEAMALFAALGFRRHYRKLEGFPQEAEDFNPTAESVAADIEAFIQRKERST